MKVAGQLKTRISIICWFVTDPSYFHQSNERYILNPIWSGLNVQLLQIFPSFLCSLLSLPVDLTRSVCSGNYHPSIWVWYCSGLSVSQYGAVYEKLQYMLGVTKVFCCKFYWEKLWLVSCWASGDKVVMKLPLTSGHIIAAALHK